MRGGEESAFIRIFGWGACVAVEVETDGGYLAVHAGRIINIDGKNYRPAHSNTPTHMQLAEGASLLIVNYPVMFWV